MTTFPRKRYSTPSRRISTANNPHRVGVQKLHPYPNHGRETYHSGVLFGDAKTAPLPGERNIRQVVTDQGSGLLDQLLMAQISHRQRRTAP